MITSAHLTGSTNRASREPGTGTRGNPRTRVWTWHNAGVQASVFHYCRLSLPLLIILVVVASEGEKLLLVELQYFGYWDSPSTNRATGFSSFQGLCEVNFQHISASLSASEQSQLLLGGYATAVLVPSPLANFSVTVPW